MPLTEIEELKLSQYFQDKNIPETQQNRIREIANMSKEGVTIKEIRAALRSSFDFVSEHRMKLRRAGVW